jgi:hypothetical protein
VSEEWTTYLVRCPRGHFLSVMRIHLPLFAGKPIGAVEGFCKRCQARFESLVDPERAHFID